MEPVEIDVEAFKREGFSYEEIQSIIQAEKDIANWETYTHDEVKAFARKQLFSNAAELEHV